MASSSHSAAVAHCSSVGAALGSPTGVPSCRDLPAGRMSISASAASEFSEARPSVHTDAGIPPLAGAGRAVAASTGETLVDEGSLLLDAIEASYKEERAPLSS